MVEEKSWCGGRNLMHILQKQTEESSSVFRTYGTYKKKQHHHKKSVCLCFCLLAACERKREESNHMYSAMIFSVVSERSRLMRSERRDMFWFQT